MVSDTNDQSSGGTAGFAPQVGRATTSFQAPGRMAGGVGDDGRRLVVGRDIVLTGSIGDCDNLIIEGRVEAELADSKRIEITETGTFKGTVEIDEAVIAGHFSGDLTVRDRLVIKSTGRVEGKVRYGELEIQSGGEIRGEIDVFGSAGMITAEVVEADDMENTNEYRGQDDV
jgi:cytoskeletal protein CcmA (bactofilin family)